MYKNEDGSWNRSAIISRGHAIARSLDDDRAYSERLSEGMTQAWGEAKNEAEKPDRTVSVADSDWETTALQTTAQNPREAAVGMQAPDGFEFEFNGVGDEVELQITPTEPVWSDEDPGWTIDRYVLYDTNEDQVRNLIHLVSVVGMEMKDALEQVTGEGFEWTWIQSPSEAEDPAEIELA